MVRGRDAKWKQSCTQTQFIFTHTPLLHDPMNDENYGSCVEMKNVLVLRSYNHRHCMVDWLMMRKNFKNLQFLGFFVPTSAQKLDVFQLEINKNIDFNLLWINEKELLLIFVLPFICIYCHYKFYFANPFPVGSTCLFQDNLFHFFLLFLLQVSLTGISSTSTAHGFKYQGRDITLPAGVSGHTLGSIFSQSRGDFNYLHEKFTFKNM